VGSIPASRTIKARKGKQRSILGVDLPGNSLVIDGGPERGVPFPFYFDGKLNFILVRNSDVGTLVIEVVCLWHTFQPKRRERLAAAYATLRTKPFCDRTRPSCATTVAEWLAKAWINGEFARHWGDWGTLMGVKACA